MQIADSAPLTSSIIAICRPIYKVYKNRSSSGFSNFEMLEYLLQCDKRLWEILWRNCTQLSYILTQTTSGRVTPLDMIIISKSYAVVIEINYFLSYLL